MVRGLTANDQRKVIQTEKFFPNFRSSTKLIQNFDFRLEIRPNTLVVHKGSLDPTTWIELMIETIDRSDMTDKIVGFAYFPLFLAPTGQSVPNNPNSF